MRIRGAVLEEIGTPRPYAKARPITVRELELDEPGPDEVLVQIEAAGICHSDLSVVDGNRVRPVPMLLGHEAAGRVVRTGANVTDLAVGQRVVMAFLPRCGQCANCATDGKLPCVPGSAANNAGTLLSGGMRLHQVGASGGAGETSEARETVEPGESGASGEPWQPREPGQQPLDLPEDDYAEDDDASAVYHHLGVSGFADYAVLDRRSLVPVGDDVPPQIAAVLGCAVLTGGGAVLNVGQPQEGETTVIVGLGGVGMAALITVVSLGHGEVIGVDAVPEKLRQAKELGASAVYSPQEALAQGVKAPVVIEAAGNARAFETAVSLTAPGGKTVTVGLPAPDAKASIAPLGITAEARTIVGSYLGSAVPSRDIPRYAQLWREGKLPVEALISSTIRLDQINQAMDELADGHTIRQVILFDEPGAKSVPSST